ncbi:MAG TPA: hypothetical protein VLE99_03935 [Candidatus Saccharimonadales bacterium]|nr:hypothetical protein [Candidatus Saccharimonadales bacterium]
MSKQPGPEIETVEESVIWREACDLAEYMYGIVHELREHGEEFRTESKIKYSANDLMFYVAQALGNAIPSGAQFEWGNARRNLSSLKTMYRFAGRQKFLVIDPAIMVRLDKLNKLIEAEIQKAAAKTKAANEAQLSVWREEYSLWRKMNQDSLPSPRRTKQ